jgi:catechol 2,3-dioxygenase-like lactoylglutathione lyase family enzyme
MQVRFARHTDRLPELMHFYGERLGLPELGRFDDHDGYSGVFYALPGTNAHLEFTSGGRHKAPPPHPETMLVLYLGNREAVEGTVRRVGTEPVEPANPYWETHAVTLADPDGFRVVLVPEVGPET